MKGRKFADDEDVICTAIGWLEDQDQQFFYNGIRALEKRWTKCNSVEGDYVENLQNTMCISYGYLCQASGYKL